MVSEEEFPNELSDPSSPLYETTQESVIKTVSIISYHEHFDNTNDALGG